MKIILVVLLFSSCEVFAQNFCPVGKPNASVHKLIEDCVKKEGWPRASCKDMTGKDCSIYKMQGGVAVIDPVKLKAKNDAIKARDDGFDLQRARLDKIKAACSGEVDGLLKDICLLISGGG